MYDVCCMDVYVYILNSLVMIFQINLLNLGLAYPLLRYRSIHVYKLFTIIIISIYEDKI